MCLLSSCEELHRKSSSKDMFHISLVNYFYGRLGISITLSNLLKYFNSSFESNLLWVKRYFCYDLMNNIILYCHLWNNPKLIYTAPSQWPLLIFINSVLRHNSSMLATVEGINSVAKAYEVNQPHTYFSLFL